MKFESKYDINQVVWRISLQQRKEFFTCLACEGTGSITLKDKKPRTCPECYGRLGKYEWFEEQWLMDSVPYTIGKITIEFSNIEPDGMFDNIGHYKEGNDKHRIKYMAYETGIGSGSSYPEESLFESKEKALQECEVKNKNENRNNENRS